MKKRQLEMLLERVKGFDTPSFQREQYSTPSRVAADLLYLAWLRGELGRVVDLGCGTGILAIGAALLNAKAIGVELDPFALSRAKENARSLGVQVDFIRADVRHLSLRQGGTVVMNPPFGAQKTSIGDREFLKKAVEIGDVIYSIHNAGSEEFIRRFVEPCTISEIYRIPFPLKRCFEFHSKDVQIIEVELYRIICRDRAR
jgi:putative methylase